MRLAQIARKLKVKTSEVVAFVEEKFDDQMLNAPNTKVPDAYVQDIIERFTATPEAQVNEDSGRSNQKINEAKKTVDSDLDTATASEGKTISSSEKENSLTTKQDSTSEIEEHNPGEIDSDDIDELNIEDGVIKAPKVEVQGIKVVGKIELPKTKEELAEELPQEEHKEDQTENDADSTDIDQAEKPEKKTKVSPVQKKKKSSRRKKPERKPTSHQEQEALAQKQHEERMKEEKLREKKKKKAHYEKMMQDRQQKSSKKSKTSPSKLKEISKKNKSAQPKPTKKEPKTLWGKFMRWLNT